MVTTTLPHYGLRQNLVNGEVLIIYLMGQSITFIVIIEALGGAKMFLDPKQGKIQKSIIILKYNIGEILQRVI